MSTKTFEDVEVGFAWRSQRRTVTEADVVGFAGLSGDFNPLPMDQEFAKTTIFGQRIAHGLLGLSMASGLRDDEPSWAIMAFMGLDWKFVKPIFIGDTVFVRSEVKNKKDLGKGDRGIVVLSRQLVNQREEVTQEGTFTLLLSKKNAA